MLYTALFVTPSRTSTWAAVTCYPLNGTISTTRLCGNAPYGAIPDTRMMQNARQSTTSQPIEGIEGLNNSPLPTPSS